jgi:ribosomal protein S6--L-glutamate ligase
MKFPKGTQGKGVLVADSYGSASSMLDALSALRQPFIIQEYVETGSTDTRAIVVGDKVIAAMKRKAELGEKRSNIHAGGEGETVLLDTHTRKIAVQAAKSIGADICAVDILESVKGPVVIEVNVSPGLQGITKATGINVADKIARFLFEKATDMKKSKDTKSTKEIMRTISGPEKQIVTNLDFRGDRILMSDLVSKMSKFSEKDEVVVKVKEKKITIEKI